MTASVRVHGIPGRRLVETGARRFGAADARRGAFIERAVARGLEHWLSRRPDCAGLHLFHDLSGFRDDTSQGLGPVSLGRANIDHVVLSGARWLLIDAKGLGAGTLTTDPDGRGVLVRPDGISVPQRWMDSTRPRSAAGVLFRLTGLRGWPVWILPDVTTLDLAGLAKARAFRSGGTVSQIGDVYSGSLDEVFPVPQPPADTAAVAALARYVAGPAASAADGSGSYSEHGCR
jgi:hypothetical protein